MSIQFSRNAIWHKSSKAESISAAEEKFEAGWKKMASCFHGRFCNDGGAKKA